MRNHQDNNNNKIGGFILENPIIETIVELVSVAPLTTIKKVRNTGSVARRKFYLHKTNRTHNNSLVKMLIDFLNGNKREINLAN